MIRSDAAEKLRGAARYGVDLDRPGMLWAALVPAPVAHARIRSIDLDGARRSPGVVAAVGAEDLPSFLPAGYSRERPVFPATEIVYRNQPVAAVAATSREAARAGAGRVRFELEPLPILPDLDSIFPEWPGPAGADSPHVLAHVHARHGPVEELFRTADRVRRDEFRTSGVAQVPLEPHACLAEIRDGRWHVTTSTQTPFGVREDTAEILGLPVDDIVVEGSWVGGGFGAKGGALLEPYALLLARAADRPVRLALSYREEFELTRSTLPARIALESAVSGGRLRARKVRLLLDTGASLPGRDFATGYAIGFLLGPYRLEAFEVEGFGVRTNKPPFGPHRAPFVPQCVFATDGHTELLARDLGADPIAFREANVWTEGDATPFGQTVGPFGAVAALGRVRALRDRWRLELPAGTGLGVGLGYWSTSTGAGGEARIVLTAEEVILQVGEREIGSGSIARGLAAVAERTLGAPPEAVRVEYQDTASAPFDSGVFGSRTLGALGGAVHDAAQALGRELGQRLGGSEPARLVPSARPLRARAGTVERPVADLLTPEERAAGGLVQAGRHYGRSGALDSSRIVAGEFYPYTDFTAAVHLAAVRVDPETGQVLLLRYAAVHDAGSVVDDPTYRTQIEGGVAMGLGTALTEEMLWDAEGRLENPGLLDYRIPTFPEIPPIEIERIEGFGGAGPYGAKGIGEPPIVPVAAAVANAVLDATGVRPTDLPLTPERVARALKRR
ncbi:MAG: xanthine dehydrogenase family protein molybdopterin-binding subunit [Thermoplasmata archaeon]